MSVEQIFGKLYIQIAQNSTENVFMNCLMNDREL